MLIRDRIFQKLDELDMTQKEFSIRTGIPQTTISDWRKKRTNPTAEKIMVAKTKKAGFYNGSLSIFLPFKRKIFFFFMRKLTHEKSTRS